MAFGSHPNHDSYGGLDEVMVKSRPETITLNHQGDFILHDHKDPVATGYFTVEPR